MAKSSNFALKIRDILATPKHEGFVDQLLMRKETDEYQTGLDLYDFCASKFADCFTLKLLNVYQCSSNGVIRFKSIDLLSDAMVEFGHKRFELSLDALYEIKPILISCLTMQETKESEFPILGRIVSFVASNVVMLDNDGWDELSDCIVSLADEKPLKAFHVFLHLPPLYPKFIYKVMHRILEKACEVLLNPKEGKIEDWILGLETVVKLGVQLLDTEIRYDLAKTLFSILVKSTSDLMNKGMDQFLIRGLESLESFLARETDLYGYNMHQHQFVSAIIFKMEAHTESIPTIKLNPSLVQSQEVLNNHGAESDSDCYDHLKNLSPVKLLRVFASTDAKDRSRELAIRQLNVLLSDHTSKKVKIDISVMRNLQPMLISCLYSKGISDSMFKVLGEVVNHVAYEMFYHQKVTWFGLRDYIASQSKTEFERAVYIFQCLTAPLEEEQFVIHVTENLFPEIITRLNPPRETTVDNSCWVLAFTGAFCSIIHSIEIPSQAKSVKEIAFKMIEAVKELVGRKMEVGLVRSAFRDLERIVKKQLGWYGMNEYKFVKGLLWRLYEIQGMKGESKMVLWRVNVILERGVKESEKELPKSDLHWINQSAED